MKKKTKIFSVIFISAAAALIIFHLAANVYSSVMADKYEKMSYENNFSPEEVIYQLADCWSKGNTKGVSLLCAEDFNIADIQIFPYSFYEDFWRPNVKISECTEIPEPDDHDRYQNYYDRHYYRARWNGDDLEPDWRGGGFAFILVAKETENSPYKICSMFTGW